MLHIQQASQPLPCAFVLEFLEVFTSTSICFVDVCVCIHQAEKNWGAAFPDAWIWAEGISLVNPNTNLKQSSRTDGNDDSLEMKLESSDATQDDPSYYFALAGGPTKIFGPVCELIRKLSIFRNQCE
jgi:hypothetical protein